MVVGERALPGGKAYDDTLLYEVCEPNGLYNNDYPHEWDAKGDFTGYGRIKFRDGLKSLADSLSMHMNSLTGKRIKDHDASMAISFVQRVQRHTAQSIIKP